MRTFGYDGHGRLQSRTTPALGTTSSPSSSTDIYYSYSGNRRNGFSYDAAGNLAGSVITVTVVEATETTPAWAALGAAVHVRVSPNPWRGTRTPARDIEFDGLPAGSMLEIFALSGRLVKRFPDAGVSVRWNRIMDSRETAPAGVYWYVVTDARGMQTDRGKLLIVK